MMNCSIRRLIAIGAAASLPSLVGAESAPDAKTAEQIFECVKESAPRRTSVQQGSLRVENKRGAVRESKAKIWWGRFDGELSRVLVRFSAPEDLRGSSLLVLEQEGDRAEMFMYLPELRRVKRVTARTMTSSVFGTHFSYEDLERLYRLAKNSQQRRLTNGEVAGHPVYVVETIPSPDLDSTYDRVLEYIEIERCVALKLEFFEGGSDPTKVVHIDPTQLHKQKNVWVPERFKIEDRKHGGNTIVTIDKAEVDVDLDERMFSQGRLARGR